MEWNSVPHGMPCDSKSFVTILCSGTGGMMGRVLSDAERVTGRWC